MLTAGVLLLLVGAALPSLATSAPAVHGAPVAGRAVVASHEAPSPGVSVLQALHARHIPARDAYLPNYHGGGRVENGTVTPLYSSAPAPMGLGDFGLYRNGSGGTAGHVERTRSVRGTAVLNSSDAFYLDDGTPFAFGLQLNTVDANVTVAGNTSDVFWNQNVVFYDPSTDNLSFIDNIWNFSSPSSFLPASTILSGNGTVVAPIYYYALGPSLRVPMPFTVSLYTNTTVLHNDSVVFFNYTLVNSTGGRSSGSYDEVVFHSDSAHAAQSVTPAPEYEISGLQLTPTGYLLYDAELILGGPGGGSTTDFRTLGGSLDLELWNSTSARYAPTPSAYDFGTDTGETASGVATLAAAASPAAVQLEAGPSFLRGLWNVTGAVTGENHLLLLANEPNAFLFLSPGTPFNASVAQWCPLAPTPGPSRIALLPDSYSYELELSGFDPVTGTIPNASTAVSLLMTANRSQGVYTPLIAWTNAELAGLSSAGNGSEGNPFVLLNQESAPLSSLFAHTNDFTFPEFPGLLLVDSTSWVRIESPPSFEVWMLPSDAGPLALGALPPTNDLQIQLYNTSHVILNGSTGLTGWFFGPYLAGFPIANLMLWNSTNDLIESDRFLSTGASILVYGGANDTVWNNLLITSEPTNDLFLGPIDAANPDADGLTLYASGDLVYDNYFADNLVRPAATPTIDPTTGAPVAYLDQWNVSALPAGANRSVDGQNLSGCIIGCARQGGNYWGNYGAPTDPYGLLPYTDSGQITAGGDHLPLVPVALFTVQFSAPEVPAGTVWSVELNGTGNSSVGPAAVGFLVPEGTYVYRAFGVPGLSASEQMGAVTVAGSSLTVLLEPPAASSDQYIVSFVEVGLDCAAGLATPCAWQVGVNGTVVRSNGSPTVQLLLANGTYGYAAQAAGYEWLSRMTGTQLTVAGAGTVVLVDFALYPGTLLLNVTPASATLTFDGYRWGLYQGGVARVVPAGNHTIFASAPGYLNYSAEVAVAPNQSVHLAIVLQEVPGSGPGIYHNSTVGPSAALLWTLGIGLVALAAAVVVAAALLRRPERPSAEPPARAVEPWHEGSEGPAAPAPAPPPPAPPR